MKDRDAVDRTIVNGIQVAHLGGRGAFTIFFKFAFAVVISKPNTTEVKRIWPCDDGEGLRTPGLFEVSNGERGFKG